MLTRKIIQDGAENADVSRNEYHKRSPFSTKRNPTEYHRGPRLCCVLLTSNAIKFRYNEHSDWLKSMLYESIKQGAICESHHVVVFKTKVLHFRYKNTPLFERHKWNGKVQKNTQFSFCGQGKILVAKSSFEEFNDVSFKAEHKMSCLKFIQGSKVFEDFSGTFLFLLF